MVQHPDKHAVYIVQIPILSNMKNADKFFFAFIAVSYFILYGVMAMLS